MSKKYYVTMTDNYMSGWGRSKGRINKLVFVCNNWSETQIVFDNAINRNDQKYVNIRFTTPYYNSKKYYTEFKTKNDYPKWFIKGAF